MQALWRYLEYDSDFETSRTHLRSLLSAGVCDILLDQNWFIEGRQPSEYPCCLSRAGCCMFVKCTKTEHGFQRWAVCNRWPRSIDCQPVDVTYDTTRLLKFNQHGLTNTLRTLLNLQGEATHFEYGKLTIFRLGRKGQFPNTQDFYLVLNPDSPSFDLFLRELPVHYADTWVFVPSWEQISPDMRVQFSVKKSVTIWALSDLLHIEQNCLQLSCLLRKSHQRFQPFPGEPQHIPQSPPVCLLHCHDGSWLLNRDEYQLLCDHTAHFHFMIDMTAPSPKGHYNAWRSCHGLPESRELSGSEAHALSHLITSAKPLLPRQIQGLQHHQQAAKVVERARSKIDLGLGRCDWRAFQTISEDGLQRFCFRPKPNLRWALLLPPTTQAAAFTDQRVLDRLFTALPLNAPP